MSAGLAYLLGARLLAIGATFWGLHHERARRPRHRLTLSAVRGVGDDVATSDARPCRSGPSPFVQGVEAVARSAPAGGAAMAEYIIFFNQQWVGDHTAEWFGTRGPLARAVVEEMKAAGVYVYAGGLEEEIEDAFSADATSGALVVTDGPFIESKEWLGGLTIVDVPDAEAAAVWAGKVAVACGWPQEVRRFKS
jgi:hypothetical protein